MNRSSIEAVLSHQRDKAGLANRGRAESFGGAADERERLGPSGAERDDHPAVGRQLFYQRRGGLRGPPPGPERPGGGGGAPAPPPRRPQPPDAPHPRRPPRR